MQVLAMLVPILKQHCIAPKEGGMYKYILTQYFHVREKTLWSNWRG